MLPLDLPFAVLRVTLTARERVDLPPFPGSKLEGAFGRALYRLACSQPHLDDCRACPLRDICPYGLTYVPRLPPEVRASSLGTPPRPIVFRVPHDAERTLAPGEDFTFDLTVAGAALSQLPYLIAALRAVGNEGLGRTRGRLELRQVESLNPYTNEARMLTRGDDLGVNLAPLVLDAASLPEVRGERVTLHFRSLTHVQVGGRMAEQLHFPVLLRALQRRVTNLEQLYGGQSSLGADFDALPHLARSITTVRHDLRPAHQARKGHRPHERAVMHGLLGTLTFEGNLAPFSALLRYGEHFGVGKWAHFGAGLYNVREHS